ncbi:quinoprotein dehydrogenase-associated SoxYZ-like carrier [Insolitispirillum peregrinum]|uniref:quinoprotein dehydrogenase-associated SoxYZ-like carrier n=1 Tax=Insolitispirillum peregrinum TaxID=80876 RepID=UPI0036061AB3
MGENVTRRNSLSRYLPGWAVAVSVIWGVASAHAGQADPLASVMWDSVHQEVLAGQPVVFDPAVRVITAARVENTMQVPIEVEVDDSVGPVSEIVVFADHNPIPRILTYRPLSARPRIGLSFKVQEATPIRAAARTADGVWHVGGQWADAAGGGCTTPSAGQRSRAWESHLNEATYHRWPRADGSERLQVSLIHPMDTGLAPGIPAFYLTRLVLRDQDGTPLAELLPAEPVAENPLFALDLRPARPGKTVWRLEGGDSDGNLVAASLPPSPQEGSQ